MRARLVDSFASFLVTLLACVGAFAQAGDKAGEEQPPLPDDLVVPPAPALTPEEQRATFRVPPGFRVELAAAEPLVHDPVAIAFDGDGRLWVVEMRTYMPNVDGEGELEPASTIAVLSDSDGDGRFDERRVFLDGLVLPRAVLPMGDGALVITPPEIAFWRDLDGDGGADERTLVDSGVGGLQSPEHAVNGLLPTLDNWIACANHPWRYRFDGATWLRQRTAGGGQWGIAQDDSGRLVFNTNSDALRGDLIPSHYAVRNPNLGTAAGTNVRIAADQRVFPARITPGINRGYQPQMLRDFKLAITTGACGPLIHRGDGFPMEFRGNAFVAEPCGNLVKRYRVDELDGGLLGATPTYADDEFLTSTDERFRPVNLADGPDGALWIVDMYRGLIQHRIFVTTFLRKQVVERGLEQPIGLGRIWRVVHDDAPAAKPARIADASWTELAALLAHPNGWWRDQAQRVFVAEGRGDANALELARASAVDPASALGRMHALWALEGCGGLDAELLRVALVDADPRVRLAAVRCSEAQLARGDEGVLRAVRALGADDADARVRWQAVLSLGEARTTAADRALFELLSGDAASVERRTAALSGLFGRELELVERALDEPRWSFERAGRAELLELAARCVAVDGRADRIEALLARVVAEKTVAWQRAALVDGLLSGRPKGPDGRPSFLWLTREPPTLETLGSIELPGASGERKREDLIEALAWPGREGLELVEVRPLSEEERALYEHGRRVYAEVCAQCHQASGQGEAGKAPPLRHSPFVLDSKARLIHIVTGGMSGPLELAGEHWNMDMPAYSGNDEATAAVLTYIRREWGHGADPISPAEVQATRTAAAARTLPWTAKELEALFPDAASDAE